MSATDEPQAGAATATCQRTGALLPNHPGSDVQACMPHWAQVVPMAPGPEASGWPELEWASGP